MRITGINPYGTFTSSKRVVFEDNIAADKYAHYCPNVKYRNTTYLYRGDINWHDLRNYLAWKYKGTDKVNVYCYACSDGSEPYTLAMELDNYLGENAKKFFPIMAKDIDEYIINQAKSGVINLYREELFNVHKQTNFGMDKYLTRIKNAPLKGGGKRLYKINDNIKPLVEFEQADMTKDIENIKPDNSVILMRNVWPYIKNPDIFARKLYKIMGKNSVLVIGGFDKLNRETINKMVKLGLKQKDNLIFEKD